MNRKKSFRQIGRSTIPALLFTALAFAVATLSTAFKPHRLAGDDKALDELVALMSGSFSSAAQAAADTNYYNISLVMTPVFTDRTDGKWLYVEQAVASRLNKPYRQRVYHLQHRGGDFFTSDIYIIKNAQAVVGLQQDASRAALLAMDSLELKDGCTVTLVKRGDHYTGGTDGKQCPSDLRGASYATSRIVLSPGKLESWDQGFDASGKQVWGATKGGYVFLKQP